MKMIHPVEYVYYTQLFGERPEVYSRFGYKGHNGIDYRTTVKGQKVAGQVPFRAPLDGVVLEIGFQKTGYGHFIRLGHGGNSQTVYGHNSSIEPLKVGDKVKQGQKLGVTGNTGFSTGAHLHFGIRPNGFDVKNGYGGYVDPFPYLPNPGHTQTSELFTKEEMEGDSFAKTWAGWLILDVENGGRVWFVSPKSLKRYPIDQVSAEVAKKLAKDGGWIGMSSLDLNRIAEA